jgi:sRNA-binding regulator protein Hfq
VKRIPTTLFLALAIFLCPLGPAARAQQLDQTAKVKAEITNRLNKKEGHVKVKLRNGSEVKGHITQTSENGFTVADEKTRSRTDIAYAEKSPDRCGDWSRGICWDGCIRIDTFLGLRAGTQRFNARWQQNGMCRNIKTLHNFKPPATEEEIRASSLQFVRKLSGFTKPSKTNELAFNRAVEQVAQAAKELLDSLVTNAPPRDREVEAEKARARSAERFGAAAQMS